ncbi:Protein kinase domain [Phytophthora infestans]|uniref:Protein kinase domain n=1 Tax=Phytophthora infestans TaxID=4787 RepID=A0A8S9U7J8_PHYIN|nr:Protein kinase domain [Phytophthora infestans]
MFASMLQWALEVGLLVQTQTSKPRGIFRSQSSSSKKKLKKDRKNGSRSDRRLLQTEHTDTCQVSPDMAGALFHQVVESCREYMATLLQDAQVRLPPSQEKEEAELSARAAKNALPFARNMLPHEPMEALTLLKFEIDFFKPGNTVNHVASMKKVFFSVVRSSNGRVAKIPDWYIPPYAMSYSRDKVMQGSVGTAHRGVWVDRKPEDGKKPERDEGERPPKTFRVVVKRLTIHADAIEAFRQEVESWVAMDHPNYLSRQRQVQADKRRRRDSDQLEQPWPYRNQRHALWSLFLQAASGLKYLHEDKKLVHGNLKSANILVAADGQVKLTDFGLGILALQNQAIQSERFHELGWRAPNCWKDKKLLRRPGFQDDIYSLGLCVLDVLVASRSSIAKGEIKCVGDEEFDPLDKSVSELIHDERHRKLVEDMCQPKPGDRLQLTDVIKRMEEMREAAAREPMDSSDCCML